MGVQSVFGAALVLHVAEVCLCNVSLGSWGERYILREERGPFNLSELSRALFLSTEEPFLRRRPIGYLVRVTWRVVKRNSTLVCFPDLLKQKTLGMETRNLRV